MTAPRTPAIPASARGAAWIVLLHAAVLLAHEIAHRRLGVELQPWQIVFAYGVIVAAPLLALALLIGRRRSGFALLAIAMAASLLFTVFHHYIHVSPDHVAHLPPGPARPLFQWTAAALALLEAAGTWAGWRGWRSAATFSSGA